MLKDMRITNQLKNKIFEAVGDVKGKALGIAFSGGVDSSLLATVCRDLDENVTLLTVGFSNIRDIKISNEVSETIGLNLLHDLIPLEELENGLKVVLATIEFDRLVRLENCLSFYYVFRLASNNGLETVLSANGIDELFCGYSVYKKNFGDERALRILMETLVELAKNDKKETDKISKLFSIQYICPFLFDSFIDFSMEIPLEFKIKSKEDDLRKHIWREVALDVGAPKSVAFRAKKAFQYSSGIHKAISKLARRKGYTRKKAKTAGFQSEMEFYLRSLKVSLEKR